MPARKRPLAGFSLVELMIVVLLMGVLAAIVIPRLEPGIYERLDGGAQLLAGDLAYARNLAVTNSSNYRVTFDPTENRYVLEHSGANPLLNPLPPSPLGNPGDPATRRTTDFDELPQLGGVVEIVAVYKIASTPQLVGDVEFGPLGETTRAEETVIWLGSGTGAERRYIPLKIDPVTGLVAIGSLQTAPPSVAAAAAPGP